MGNKKVLYLLSFPKPRLKLAEVEGNFFQGLSLYFFMFKDCNLVTVWAKTNPGNDCHLTGGHKDPTTSMLQKDKNVFMNTALE